MTKVKMSKKKVFAALSAGVLLLGTAGISAYFTDNESATNKFTVGKISLDLIEDHDPEDPDNPDKGWDPERDKDEDGTPDVDEVIPEQEVPKSPFILNDGLNREYVFMSVTVPYKNIVTANEDGTRNEAADTELFSYDINAGWTELTEFKVKDEDDQYITHLYAYTGDVVDTMEVLEKDANTPALFNYVRFCNAVEGQELESTARNIVVKAYGIQSTNINDSDQDIDGDNTDGLVNPSDVWKVIANQGSIDFTKIDNEAIESDD